MIVNAGKGGSSGGGGVSSVSAALPLVSTGGTTPQISITGLSTIGTANQLIGVNAGATGIEYKNGIVTNQQDAVHINPFGTSAGNTGELRFYELAANGSNYAGFKASDNITASSVSMIYTLPAAIPAGGEVLTAGAPTGGNCILSWTNPVTHSSSGAEDYIQFSTGTGDFNSNPDGYFVWQHNDLQLLLKNPSGISFPSYSFVDAPTMGMYYDTGNLGITANSGNMLLTCVGLSMNGNAGFTGSGTFTNFTIENGIITAAS